jgi:hypothetical protein
VQLVGASGHDGRLLRTSSALIEMLRETKKGRRAGGNSEISKAARQA